LFVVDHVEEKRIAEGVCVLRDFVTYKAGDPTGRGLSGRERERVAVFGIERNGYFVTAIHLGRGENGVSAFNRRLGHFGRT